MKFISFLLGTVLGVVAFQMFQYLLNRLRSSRPAQVSESWQHRNITESQCPNGCGPLRKPSVPEIADVEIKRAGFYAQQPIVDEICPTCGFRRSHEAPLQRDLG